MVSDRRKLWPNYARPHVVVFAAISAVFIIGWPMAVSVSHGMNSAGLLALIDGHFRVVRLVRGDGLCADSHTRDHVELVTMQSAAGRDRVSEDDMNISWAEFCRGCARGVGVGRSWMLRLTGNDAVLTRTNFNSIRGA